MQEFGSWVASNRALFTFFVFIGVLLAREIGIRIVRRSTDVLTADHRRHISIIHHSSMLLLVGFTVIVWASQLQEFALSITAIAASPSSSRPRSSCCACSARPWCARPAPSSSVTGYGCRGSSARSSSGTC